MRNKVVRERTLFYLKGHMCYLCMYRHMYVGVLHEPIIETEALPV